MHSTGWRAGTDYAAIRFLPAALFRNPSSRRRLRPMSTATTTSHNTGQHTTSRTTAQPTNTATHQQERSAANRLRATTAAVKLCFTWLGVRKTLAPEHRTTAARAFHADRELLTASKLILDTKNPACRAVAAVRSEASSYWRTVTLPFPEAGIRLLSHGPAQWRRERPRPTASRRGGALDTVRRKRSQRVPCPRAQAVTATGIASSGRTASASPASVTAFGIP